jgi:hypothetical protein
MSRGRWLKVMLLGLIPLVLGAASSAARGQQPDGITVETLLDGVEQRSGLVRSARVTMAMDIVASEEQHAEHLAYVERVTRDYGLDEVPECQRRDIACTRFAYEGDRCVWQFALLNASGYNWWGIDSLLGAPRPERTRPSLDALYACGAIDGDMRYSFRGTPRECRLGASGAARLIDLDANGLFTGLFVEIYGGRSLKTMREEMAPRLLGNAIVDGEECYVIAAMGQKPPPKGIYRLWVCPRLGSAVVRQERVSIRADGQLGPCSVQTASGFEEIAEGVWLPRTVRIDMFGIGGAGWRCTKRFDLVEVTVNEPVTFEPADYLFPLNCRWTRMNEGVIESVWDGGAAVRQVIEERALPEPDPLWQRVLAHEGELEEWMMQVPPQ